MVWDGKVDEKSMSEKHRYIKYIVLSHALRRSGTGAVRTTFSLRELRVKFDSSDLIVPNNMTSSTAC